MAEHKLAGAQGEAAVSDDDEGAQENERVLEQASKSSNMVSVLVIVSRITGFLRTIAQAWAIGVTMLASCYTIADQLPNILYELVVGGMLITAFLPVYVKVRNDAGAKGATGYASNLLSIVLMLMVALTLLSFLFAEQIIWTQSAGATEAFDADLAVWFFRWFSVEIVLYACSSIFSGVLNAERDYLWSNAAPILNNLIIIGAFLLFGATTRAGLLTESQAMVFLAVGNPLGVAVQVLVQVPALRRHGVRLRLRVSLRDPALRETLSIGLPTLLVTLAAYPSAAVMSSCALSVTESGAAVAYYARVWYMLPFSVFAIPISVTMFTELSQYHAAGDRSAFVTSFSRGASRIAFTVVPFVLLFQVFAPLLVQVIAGSRFSDESLGYTVLYLRCIAFALPFYSFEIYLQKLCSAMFDMRAYLVSTVAGTVVQIVACLALTPVVGLALVPLSSVLYYGTIDVGTLLVARRKMGRLGLAAVARAAVRGFAFGALGALVGWAVSQGLELALGPAEGTLRAVLYAVVSGIPSLVACFGCAYVLGMSEAPFFNSIFDKLARLARRSPRSQDRI